MSIIKDGIKYTAFKGGVTTTYEIDGDSIKNATKVPNVIVKPKAKGPVRITDREVIERIEKEGKKNAKRAAREEKAVAEAAVAAKLL
ncbi:unnamed protein product [Candida verbasci]|uniref:Uncharacterized protein n=1 Tax=Candida verbasci TaxID=1227364 RepID=A0A9W4XIL9_9ASCO|nr:unnamed protein product [Candida verbasci]